MFGGNKDSFHQKSLKLTSERDSRSRSPDGRYRSGSEGDGAIVLKLVALF